MIIDQRVTDATGLRSLLSAIEMIDAECRERGEDSETCYDAANFPTFGGDTPTDTMEVYSWDETHLLVGDSALALTIVPRDPKEG
jgi:hypothetical protein